MTWSKIKEQSMFKHKYIYDFDDPFLKAAKDIRILLGNKGASLVEMSALGLPVPEGFIITTEVCKYYYDNNGNLPADFISELDIAIKRLESKTNKIFGDATKVPLLLSVRSGSVASMPGMMDTILNLGMNDSIAKSLADLTKNQIFAEDSYNRFVNSYEKLVGTFTADVKTQLIAAIEAVLNSWMSDRAISYRRINNISEEYGTAVTIQSMVFGNMGATSGTGVLFTRNPSSGENNLYGEFLANAQGEDIVSGTQTPLSILPSLSSKESSLSETMPNIYKELSAIAGILENHYRDMQDIEFTVENGILYILQTRSGKRTAQAAITIAVDMVNEGKITIEEAILPIPPESLNQMLHARIDEKSDAKHVAKGLPASPGAVSGIVVFSPYDAEELSHHHKVILVRTDTSPEDINGMHVSSGILTARGGMTSHAAVVARGMGKPCVCGLNDMRIDEKESILYIGENIVKKGDMITIDGDSGRVFVGEVPTLTPDFSENFKIFMSWVRSLKKMEVRANAETVADVLNAIKLGAEGIGLCRTEHMFFEPAKILLMREMIIAPGESYRQIALDKLLPLHKRDFKDIFRAMNGVPINVRLIDPPLHEFLPQGHKEKLELAKSLNLDLEVIEQRLHALHEVNPMLGHRGCRLGVTYPQIYAMQLEAITAAILELKRDENIETDLEIMMPLISNAAELENLRNLALNVISTIEERMGGRVKYKIGTMIELPRAALHAGYIASFADYFSFGTNDLTQTTYGISRDDVGSFIPFYLQHKILDFDPFVRIDEEGVGELLKIAIERGRKTKPDIKLGICGEHGGDPASIDFFYRIGMDYVSCSPYRVPIASLAAAQATLKHKDQR